MSTDPDSVVARVMRYLGFGYSPDDPVERRLQELKRAKTIRRVIWFFSLALFGYFFLLALLEVEFHLNELLYYWPEFRSALNEFFPITTVLGLPFLDVWVYWEFIMDPDRMDQYPTLFHAAVVTLAMGFAGTVMGAPGALLFGVLGNERVTPFPFNFIFRGTMSTIRAIPALVWALIYVPLGGISPFTGTLAIATDTIGNLGRLFTDELEEIESGPIEAINSTGASRPQTIIFGMLSQVFTPFIAWTLYILEINVRIAVTLGLIGGGGLGYVLITQQGLFNYTNMMATILVIFILIVSVEMISQRTRSYIRGEDETMSFKELVLGFPQRMAETLWK